MTPRIFFRPNAPLSCLFEDVPNEGIVIDEDSIHEEITDYHGNILVDKTDFEDGKHPSIDILKTLIMSFDSAPEYIDRVPLDQTWEALCSWFSKVLLDRGWVPMDTETYEGRSRCSNGKQIFFEIEVDKC